MIYSNILLNSSKRREIKIMEENERREGVLKQHFALYAKKPSMKDCFVTVFIFMICTIIGLLFQKLHFTDTNIVTIYILGVLITSILTDGYLCSIAGSFLSVVLFCFSYGTEDVFPDICSWISGNFCDYAGMLCVGGNSFR